MKIVTKTMEGIANVELFPIIGLIIFFIMFIALLFIVSRLTRGQIEEFSQLPLDKDSDFESEINDSLK